MTFTRCMGPLFQGVNAASHGFHYLFMGFLRGPFLLEENALLKKQISLLEAHEETHRQLSQENERLRALVQFKSNSSWHLIPAEVIGHQWDMWSRTLLVDRGSSAGIRTGMAVIAPLGFVGRVSEAGPSASRVILFNDPHCRVAAAVAESRISGLLIGRTSGECLLTYLPLDAKLEAGQHVVTAGGKSFCPAGIPIGVIDKIFRDPSALFLSAQIRPVLSSSSIEQILVVSSSPSPASLDE